MTPFWAAVNEATAALRKAVCPDCRGTGGTRVKRTWIECAGCLGSGKRP